jgi:N6-adenosine-specific RNA methylase IME4
MPNAAAASPPPGPRKSGILFASADRLTFLLDIPASLAAAQTLTDGAGGSGVPLSRAPPDAPHAPTEPKSARARARADNYAAEGAQSQVLQDCIAAALERIRRAHAGDWCLARPFVEEAPARRRRKRKRDDDEAGGDGAGEDGAPKGVDPPAFLRAAVSHSSTLRPMTFSAGPRAGPFPGTHSNPHASPQTLLLTHPQPRRTLAFRVPPRSAFALAALPAASPARLTVPPPRGFDLVLADPPWPNRSARRRGAYATSATADGAAALLRGLRLEGCLAEPGPGGRGGGILAVWTASPASRAAVRGPGGLFDALGLAAFEEWAWAKVARRGEPVTPLAGVWRRPYEVLHLGRLRAGGVAADDEPVVRRVVVAVPDLHSRKPCLKELFEMLHMPADYQAVEVFARNLTAGWHSWGDEAILFNWDGYWRDV